MSWVNACDGNSMLLEPREPKVNRCICCGEEISWGRICSDCEREND